MHQNAFFGRTEAAYSAPQPPRWIKGRDKRGKAGSGREGEEMGGENSNFHCEILRALLGHKNTGIMNICRMLLVLRQNLFHLVKQEDQRTPRNRASCFVMQYIPETFVRSHRSSMSMPIESSHMVCYRRSAVGPNCGPMSHHFADIGTRGENDTAETEPIQGERG